jgi:hypothetical protein
LPKPNHMSGPMSLDDLRDLLAEAEQGCEQSRRRFDEAVASHAAELRRRPPKSVEEYVLEAICSFHHDPPDNEFQFGFLAALLVIHKEALRGDPNLLADAERLFELRGTEGELH